MHTVTGNQREGAVVGRSFFIHHPLFFMNRLIDSPLNVALHLDVIRTVLSEKMKDLSILGFIPFILCK